jgi:formylglycine-generating enzyme required for sulfatase activity
MKKWFACAGLIGAMALSAAAWQPNGWVYVNASYVYDHVTGDWYWFGPNNAQWTVRLGGAPVWNRLPDSDLAQGWSWHTWPYAYHHSTMTWHYFTPAKNHWCVNLTTGVWSIFGIAPAPQTGMSTVPGGTNAGVDPDFGAYSLTTPPFYMDKYEVSKGLWDTVQSWGAANGYGDLPAAVGKAADHPVASVDWFDCVKWCNARSEREGREPVYYTNATYTQVYRTGEVTNPYVKPNANGRRLPTVLEWEYAARGGVANRRFPWGDTIQNSQANCMSSDTLAYDLGPVRGAHPVYGVDPTPHTAPMGAFSGNGYGLFDLAGNVWEWCFDWYPGKEGTDRTLRGGGWQSNGAYCRVGLNTAYTNTTNYHSVGFRTAVHAEGLQYP